MISRIGAGFGSLGLAGVMAEANLLAPKAAHASGSAASLLSKQPHFAPKAKRIIQLFMPGGPSQVDTFDYKPELKKRNGMKLEGADPKTGFFTTSGKVLQSLSLIHI